MSTDRKVVIATTTFYKSADDVRAKLAIDMVKEATQCGYQVVVVDGGSPEEFLIELTRAHAYVVKEELPESGKRQPIGVGRRQAMRIAGMMVEHSGIVVWMEPEKRSFPSEIHRVIEPIIDNTADLVVPARESELFRMCYPREQYPAECYGNLMFGLYTGMELDMWFGPRAMNYKALEHFLGYQPGSYGDMWDSIFIPVMRAKAAGLRVASVTVNYCHPAEQKQIEEGDVAWARKRLDQLNNLVPIIEKEAALLKVRQQLETPASV